MYARLKPFRCQHVSNRGGAVDSCDYHTSRGIPDQFLAQLFDARRRHGLGDTVVTQDQLIAALKEANQRRVEAAMILLSSICRIESYARRTTFELRSLCIGGQSKINTEEKRNQFSQYA